MGWALSSHSIMTSGQEPPLADLTLSEALRDGRLGEFADAADRRLGELGFAPPSEAEFDAEARSVILKEPRSEGRTSRSPSHDGSTGK